MRRPLSWLSWSALAAVFALATFTQADPDLWGHVRFGLDALRTHTLPSVDPYSFTQDVPWINHEWLSELLMALAFRTLGVPGLALLKGVLATTTLLVIWGAYRGAAFEARVAATVGSVIGWLPLARTLRPQLWTVVCLAVLVRILTRPGRDHRWWLPLLFVVWANSHGGWLVGIGVLGAWLTVELADAPREFLRSAGIGLCCVLATLVTPYGWTLWRFMVDTVHVTRPNIEEWAPLWQFGPSQWLMPAMALAVFLPLGFRARPNRWARLAVVTVLAYSGLRVVRVAPLFVEATALLLAPLVVERWPAKVLEVRTYAERVLVVAITGFLAFAGGAGLAVSLACIPTEGRTLPDPAVVSALRGAPPGRLVLFFHWGEYALWHFGPAIRVSMDGRRETVYSNRRLAEHDAILSGTAEGLQILGVWQPEYVWLPASSRATRSWLVANGYRLDVDTADSFLAVREDLPRLSPRTDVHLRHCFPE